MNPQLLQIGIQGLLASIDLIKAHHTQVNPDLPPLTDADALAILRQALDSTEAKDDAYLAVHPE